MKAISVTLTLAAAAGIAVSGAGAAAKTSASPKVAIVDSGSVNTKPFTVNVDAAGLAHVSGKARVALPKPVAAKFFADVREARLHSRPSGAVMCFKTPSGTVRRVTMGRWRSVDLNCPVIGANAVLRSDVDAILQRLHLANAPRRISLPPNEPRRVEGLPAPGAQPTGSPAPTMRPATDISPA